MKKKIFSVFFVLVLLVTTFSFPVSAASASVSVSASGSVIVGNQVKVTIKISGGEKIGSWLFSLNYDPSFLEYVSGADSGGGGSVRFSDSVDSGVSSISKTVTFRAKKIGSTSVSVTSPQIVGFDSLSNMSASGASRNINIVAAPTLSSDNNLSSLTLSSGELTPAFSPSTTKYTVSVPYEISSMEITATASDKAASVKGVSSNLEVGENKMEVVVKAENGNSKTYTITVTRMESLLAGATATVGEQEFSIAYDPTALTPPEGYTAGTSKYADRDILSYTSPQNTICIVYLTSETLSDWFLYNEEEGSFERMIALNTNSRPFVILKPSENTVVPEGFVPATVTVGEITVDAYRSDATLPENIYLIYAMANDGTCGFYYYDATLSSFSTFFEPKEPEKENVEAMALTAELNAQKEKNREMEIFLLALALLCALLFVAFLLSIFFRRRTRKATADFCEETKVTKKNAADDGDEEDDETEKPSAENVSIYDDLYFDASRKK